MELRPRLERQIQSARGVSEKYFEAFKTPQQWTHQVHPQANHALWVAGHLGMVDNFMISMIAPDRVKPVEKYAALFGMGSHPTSNAADYPPADEVLAFMRERRGVVLELLAGLSEADLAKPVPPGAPPIIQDIGSIFEAIVWHEGLHSGQVSIARRALGFAPLVDRP
jgi:hypothetical protein